MKKKIVQRSEKKEWKEDDQTSKVDPIRPKLKIKREHPTHQRPPTQKSQQKPYHEKLSSLKSTFHPSCLLRTALLTSSANPPVPQTLTHAAPTLSPIS